VILAIDTGTATLGWSLVSPRGVVHDLGALLQPLLKGEHAHYGYERRCDRQVDELVKLLPGVTLLVAESLSFARSAKAVASVSLCWGMLVAATKLRGIPRWRVPPKKWQHALLNTPSRVAVDYPVLAQRLRQHITRTGTPRARSAVAALSAAASTHALDAAGIGIYTATIAHAEVYG
jgi:hypothetical protein